MNIRDLSAALMAAGLLMAVPAFAASPTVQKQPTQEGGGAPIPCNLIANPDADPDCNYLKQRTQNLMPTSVPPNQEAPGQKK
jgi:hypothetical protein